MALASVAAMGGCGDARRPFAEAESLQCPAGAHRVFARESSYPEAYCVGDDGRTGTWLEFDADGQLRKRAVYVDGKMEGAWEAFHAGGAVETSGQMHGGMREGLWRQTYVNGAKRSEKTYRADLLDGPIRLYYMDGKLMAEGAYAAGVESGTWNVYMPDGDLARTCTLVNGEEKDCKVFREDFQPSSHFYESKDKGPL